MNPEIKKNVSIAMAVGLGLSMTVEGASYLVRGALEPEQGVNHFLAGFMYLYLSENIFLACWHIAREDVLMETEI